MYSIVPFSHYLKATGSLVELSRRQKNIYIYIFTTAAPKRCQRQIDPNLCISGYISRFFGSLYDHTVVRKTLQLGPHCL